MVASISPDSAKALVVRGIAKNLTAYFQEELGTDTPIDFEDSLSSVFQRNPLGSNAAGIGFLSYVSSSFRISPEFLSTQQRRLRDGVTVYDAAHFIYDHLAEEVAA